MKNAKQFWSWTQLVIFAIVCAALIVVGAACDQSEYHKAADAAAKISSSLKAAVTETDSIYRAHLITREERDLVLVEIDHAQFVNDEYVRQLQSFKKIDASNHAVLVNWVADLSSSVDSLNTNGVLHIKNADSQQKLGIYVTAIRGSIQILATIFGSAPPKTTTTVNPTQTAAFAFAYGG